MFRRRRPQLPAIFLLGALPLIAWRVWVLSRSGDKPPENLPEGSYAVARIDDRCTLVLTNGSRVRLLGVTDRNAQTPPFSATQAAEIAAAANKFLLERIASQPVRIQYDRERIDRENILRAYIFVADAKPGGELLLNEALISAGWAVADRNAYFNESHKRRFHKAEDDARQEKRGLWGMGD